MLGVRRALPAACQLRQRNGAPCQYDQPSRLAPSCPPLVTSTRNILQVLPDLLRDIDQAEPPQALYAAHATRRRRAPRPLRRGPRGARRAASSAAVGAYVRAHCDAGLLAPDAGVAAAGAPPARPRVSAFIPPRDVSKTRDECFVIRVI